jgi:D-alanyl-D-alanine carboxypeptidase
VTPLATWARQYGPVNRWILGLLAAAVLASCTPTQAAAPPRAELVSGQQVQTTVSQRPPEPVMIEALAEPEVSSDQHLDPMTTGEPAGGSAGGSAGEPATLTGWAAFDQSLRLRLLAGGSFTASVAVSVNGELIRAAAFGDRVPGTYDRAEPQDRFRIASLSKPITAAVLLQLQQEGLVELSQPIGQQLAVALGARFSDPRMAELTVEQLLSHTSGIPTYDSGFFGSGAEPCAVGGRRALSGSLSSPGQFRYSNMNYCLAGLLVEQLTGETYEAAVYRRLLTPLGISQMRLAGTYDHGPEEVAHFSRPGRSYMEALGAAGAWVASAADVVRIMDALDPARPGWKPLSASNAELMRRPVSDQPDALAGYGLGLMVFGDGTVGHTGTLESTHAMVLTGSDGTTWAVLVNGEFPRRSGDLRAFIDRAFTEAFGAGNG